MNQALQQAVALLGQGMAGILTVLAVIALLTALLGRMDRNRPQ